MNHVDHVKSDSIDSSIEIGGGGSAKVDMLFLQQIKGDFFLTSNEAGRMLDIIRASRDACRAAQQNMLIVASIADRLKTVASSCMAAQTYVCAYGSGCSLTRVR